MKITITSGDIEKLIKGISISSEWPWSTNDVDVIDEYWMKILGHLCGKLNLKHKSEFGHYGSGYASYVDTWIYQDNNDFRFNSGECYWGLVILYSRLSKYYVIGQGQKTWHKSGGSSYLPSFELVDNIDQEPVNKIVNSVTSIIDEFGLVRLSKHDLKDIIDKSYRIPTILSDPPWRLFDSIYYWED